MSVCRAVAEDLEDLLSLHVASWRSTYIEVFPKDYLASRVEVDLRERWHCTDFSGRDLVLAWKRKGRILGFLAHYPESAAESDGLHVHPDFHGMGIGVRLISAFAQYLVQSDRVFYEFLAFRDNVPALKVYLRMGAEVVEEVQANFFGYQVPCLRLRWTDQKLSSIASLTRNSGV